MSSQDEKFNKERQNLSASESFTFEKFKINERLGTLEVAMGQVLSAIADLKTSKNDIHAHFEKELDKTNRILYGEVGDEEKPGLIVTIAILKNESKSRDNVIKMITGAIITLAVAYIWNRFVK